MLNSLSFGSCFVFVETVDLELIVRNNKEMCFQIFGQAITIKNFKWVCCQKLLKPAGKKRNLTFSVHESSRINKGNTSTEPMHQHNNTTQIQIYHIYIYEQKNDERSEHLLRLQKQSGRAKGRKKGRDLEKG